MTQKKLNGLVAKWQKRLRIQDWDVEVMLLGRNDFEDMVGKDALGACKYHNHTKRATIAILDGPERRKSESDIETTLVHELLHIVMSIYDLNLPEDQDSPAFCAYERIVDQLSRTLREAYSGR